MSDDKLLSEQIENYLGQLFASPRTQHTYETGLRVFEKFLLEKNKTRKGAAPSVALTLDLIDTDVLQDFQAWLGKNNYSRFSHKTYLASVVAFLNYALSKDWLPETFSLERARAKLKLVTRRSAYPIPRP
ncbi:MAG: hypothetical protein DCC52_16355, partial [Chloroflexi bacterium]